MTWEDWCNSEYNVSSYYVNTYIYHSSGMVVFDGYNYMYSTQVINSTNCYLKYRGNNGGAD